MLFMATRLIKVYEYMFRLRYTNTSFDKKTMKKMGIELEIGQLAHSPQMSLIEGVAKYIDLTPKSSWLPHPQHL